MRKTGPLVLTLFVAVSLAAQHPPAERKLPKLVLQITIDQLRGDLPLRYADRFGDGGFRLLLKHGTWYAAAFHPHSHTETIVGHTTLATGAYPSRHGMVANSWFEDNKQQTTLMSGATILTFDGSASTTAGPSPEGILTTTLSDELLLTTNGGSKI
ncbi:MAG: alkaline phosphatase family protein, partial [Thermoanaerobaculia bacterium]